MTETVVQTVYVTVTSVSTDYVTNSYMVTITQDTVYPSGTGAYYYSVSHNQPTKRAVKTVPAAQIVPRIRRDVRRVKKDE